ncbi:MAG: Gfo/Idh/MocA family oxidoreductase [Akkermansiaceae bacterium]|nr:Gfo/Idh/MocA family oxidoreductase [Verrucomicrobiae bacterium]MCP5552278.1 Gfo/Idh/MocA family oxidoreductase [Akkermansiaceae bacterium]
MPRRTFLSSALAVAAAAPGLTSRAGGGPLRVAVIGHTGRGNYGHGIDTVWLHLPETKIVAVSDPDEKGRADALKRLQTTEGYADYRGMLEKVRPDLVAVCPRHVDQHRDMVLTAVAAGAKGIYIEKPFCRTLEEADEIVTACAKTKTKLAVAHRNRYHPVMPVVAKMVADGAIGRFLELRARGKEDSRGGSLDLWVLGSHLMNLMHFFGGTPLACSATVLQNGRPVTKAEVKEGDEGVGPLAGNEVHARFEMQQGLPGFFDSIQGAGTSSAGFGLQLIGTEGIIDVRTDKEPAAQWLAGSPFRPSPEPRAWVPITSGGPGKPEPLADIRTLVAAHVLPGRDLLAAIRDDRPALCSAEDGRITLEMIMAVFESHRLGGARVTLPLQNRLNPLGLLS